MTITIYHLNLQAFLTCATNTKLNGASTLTRTGINTDPAVLAISSHASPTASELAGRLIMKADGSINWTDTEVDVDIDPDRMASDLSLLKMAYSGIDFELDYATGAKHMRGMLANVTRLSD